MSSAMSQAFERAGYRSPEERLKAALAEALTKRPWDAVRSSFMAALRSDAEVMWLAFEAERIRVVDRLLQDEAERQRMADRSKEVGRGQASNGDHVRVAPSNTPKPVRLAVMVPDERGNEAQAQARRRALEIEGALVCQITQRTILDTFKIKGRAIGDLMAGEASAWAREATIGGKFVQLLVTGMQPQQRIRDCVKANEAERCMRVARSAYDAV